MYFQFNVFNSNCYAKKKKRLEFGCVVFIDQIRQKVQKNELTNIVKWQNNINKLVWQESTMRLLNDEKKEGSVGRKLGRVRLLI